MSATSVYATGDILIDEPLEMEEVVTTVVNSEVIESGGEVIGFDGHLFAFDWLRSFGDLGRILGGIGDRDFSWLACGRCECCRDELCRIERGKFRNLEGAGASLCRLGDFCLGSLGRSLFFGATGGHCHRPDEKTDEEDETDESGGFHFHSLSFLGGTGS